MREGYYEIFEKCLVHDDYNCNWNILDTYYKRYIRMVALGRMDGTYKRESSINIDVWGRFMLKYEEMLHFDEHYKKLQKSHLIRISWKP